MSIFYKSLRIGKNGKPFYMLKFRTMVEGADRIGGPSTSGDDPRLTKIGKFLRRYKIDELPQLWNIIKRDMNVCGIRPEIPEVVHMLNKSDYDILIKRRPGLTDLASLWDYNEEERLAGKSDPHKAYLEDIWPTKKKLQIYYVNNQNIWLDTKIIIRTLFKILRLNFFIIRISINGKLFEL